MKRILRSSTFWFALASIALIWNNSNDKSNLGLILILSNYPLYTYLTSHVFNHFPRDTNFVWYSWHFITYICYGLIIDIFRWKIKKRK